MDTREKIRTCQKCPLHSVTPCRPVPGVGRSKAMLVCENLSYEQAVVEMPFGCDDADYIKNIMYRAKLNYREFYYTSLTKCFETDTKNKYSEICKDWIFEEIKEKNIKYVFCLGNEVSYRLIKDVKRKHKLTDIFGKQFEQDDVIFIPIYSLKFLREYGVKKTSSVVELFHELFGESRREVHSVPF